MDKKIENENLVSVIIPCYNAEEYIAQAIESVLNQTHKNFELLIINDGSTDNSENIIKKYQQEDTRIKYYFQSNQGVSSARNEALKHSSGKIIAFLDSDDAWEPENLEVKVKVLATDENIHWVFSDVCLTDEMMNKTDLLEGGNDTNLLNSLLSRKGEIIHAPSGLVLKRECIFTYNLEFDKKATPSEDWDLCIQMAAKGFIGKRISQPLWKYRVLPNSLSRNIGNLESGNLLVLNKASKAKIFKSFLFRQKCYSNTFLILAGCWWVDGKNIPRGLFYLIKSLLYYPPNCLKVIYKIRFTNIYQAKQIPITTSENFLKRTLAFKNSKSTNKKNVTVFLFHRINTIEDPLWNPIHPKHFEEIIAYLKKHFEPVPLSDYLLNNYLQKTSKPLCAIGFDDGYRDYLDYALPILKKYDCPSSMYVVTDCINKGLPPWTYILNHLFINTSKLSLDINTETFPGHLKNTKWKNTNERINYARRLNPFLKSLANSQRLDVYNNIAHQFNDTSLPNGLMLSWKEINELKNHNCEVGSHTVSHPVLSKKLSSTELFNELKNSALEIEKHTGIFPPTISYPFGAYNEEVKAAAEEVGYKIGVTVNPTPYNSTRHDFYEVPRIELFDEPFLKTKLRINEIIPKIKKILSP